MIGPGLETPLNPTIQFTKTDTESMETLTVLYVDSDVEWDDCEILINGNPVTDTLSGTIAVGDIIYFEPENLRNIGSAPPSEEYTVQIIYGPTTSLIYMITFQGN